MNIASPLYTLYVMEIAPGAERERETKYLPSQGAVVQIGNYCTEIVYTADGCDGEDQVNGVCSLLQAGAFAQRFSSDCPTTRWFLNRIT